MAAPTRRARGAFLPMGQIATVKNHLRRGGVALKLGRVQDRNRRPRREGHCSRKPLLSFLFVLSELYVRLPNSFELTSKAVDKVQSRQLPH